MECRTWIDLVVEWEEELRRGSSFPIQIGNQPPKKQSRKWQNTSVLHRTRGACFPKRPLDQIYARQTRTIRSHLVTIIHPNFTPWLSNLDSGNRVKNRPRRRRWLWGHWVTPLNTHSPGCLRWRVTPCLVEVHFVMARKGGEAAKRYKPALLHGREALRQRARFFNERSRCL